MNNLPQQLGPERRESQNSGAVSKEPHSLEGMAASQKMGSQPKASPPKSSLEWIDPISPKDRARIKRAADVTYVLGIALPIGVLSSTVGTAVLNNFVPEKQNPDTIQATIQEQVDGLLSKFEESNSLYTLELPSRSSFLSTWKGFPSKLPDSKPLQEFLMANAVSLPPKMINSLNLTQEKSSLFDIPFHFFKNEETDKPSYVAFGFNTSNSAKFSVSLYKSAEHDADKTHFYLSEALVNANNFYIVGVQPYLQNIHDVTFYLMTNKGEKTSQELPVAYTTSSSKSQNVTFIFVQKIAE